MANVVQPAQTATTNAALAPPEHSTTEECGLTTSSSSPTVTVTEPTKASKGKGLRALRDRIALRRSYSTKHTSRSSPHLSPVSKLSTGVQEDANPPKLYAFGRLFNSKLGAKKGGKNANDSTVSPDAAPTPVSLDPAPSSSSDSGQPDGEEAPGTITQPDAVATVVEVVAATDPDPEPLSLAHKVHSLLSSLPPFLSTFDHTSNPDGKTKDGDDNSTTPDPSSTIPDSRVISLLMSPSFMNGTLSRSSQSVWSMLDNIRLKSLKSGPGAGTGTTAEAATTPVKHLVEDNDSVMFYAPLLPDETSSVELARSEIVSVDENGNILEVLVDDAPPRWGPSAGPHGAIEAFKWRWPWQHDPPAPPKPKTTEKRVWVPSATHLSLQVMWWGYKLWLPPPVLAKLNDKEIEAAKLGAIVTTALSWLLNNVPESLLPPTLRPALMLVKSLVPYLGYIGGFVAWSWSAIRGFDIGNGVTLTATWLLPIALIPGTWSNEDIPKPPPTPSDPVPPPSSSPPESPPPASNPPPPSNAPPPSSNAPPPSDSPAPPPNPSDPSTSNPPVPSPPPSNGSTTEPVPPAGPVVL